MSGPLDPQQRAQQGAALQAQLLATPATAPATPLQAATRDFVFGEIWSRPGLDRRARYLIAICSAACEPASAEIIEQYLRGALQSQALTLAELREAALHFAAYAGWSRGMSLDAALTRVAGQLGLTPAGYAPIQTQPCSAEARHAAGSASFIEAMRFNAPPPGVPFFEIGIVGFLFGEIWSRPGLDQRARRWITLVAAADSASTAPIRTHSWAAMASGNASVAEMNEFVFQYAIHGGWPKASVMQTTVLQMAERVAKGLSYD
ncbi:4-carboxymuconolactone decarboxylase [Solimonas aquatica]|uniref:4-carboxymuconolactone decarboxylase n=1 Tax=Solimonas aquatica TaxID=489703 RepID=A0A1H9FZ03_9GAMM|nr:carboxymuconolactone decarboxylase family protein [Solimonas aquatica]SEQ43140.1 4-carboxymuconolactone decarboxylase [Solimonas aquatica]